MGVRLRTTLTATAVVAVALGLAALALFTALDGSLNASMRRAALDDAAAKAAALQAGKPGGLLGAPPLPLPPGSGTGTGALSASGGKSVSGSVSGSGAGSGGVFVVAKGPGAVVVDKVVDTKNGPVTVQGSTSTAPARDAMHTLMRVLLPGGPALLALVAWLTWLSVGRVLRPVSAIRAKVAEITAHGLHERVPVPGTRDEIASLARTVNATLDRLRTAVDAHRQFVADAAHELRSPMAVLRTRLELAAPAEKPLAREALRDVDRLGSLTADLLLLSRLDARGPLRTREVDVAQLVAEEAAQRRPRTEVGVDLRVVPDVLLHGSPDHLRRMVANLVDNAVRHAASTVRVTLTAQGGCAVLDVQDDGPGIPVRDRAVVFQRFARLDAARARDTGGSGLGLPIARDIAEVHGGSLTLVSGVGGAHFRVALPRG